MKLINSKAMVLGALLMGAPAFAATPDSFITTKAKLSLMTTGGVRGRDVHIDTNDGIVTLYGKVPTAEQRTVAEKSVMDVKGVRSVRNLLQVVTDADAKRVERSDKEIKDYTEKMLKEDVALKDSKIGVKSVDKGIVLLNGKAASVSDHLRAVAMVDAVPGVRKVATEVQAPDAFVDNERPVFNQKRAEAKAEAKEAKADAKVKSAEARSSLDNMRIASAVKMRLWTTSNVPSTEINVDADNGMVTLFGMVPTAESKTLAEAEAAKVDGVTKVENQLQVVTAANKDVVKANDKDVAANLKTTFKDRAELKDVSSDVKAGVVRLTGTVDSGWDKMNAVRLARMTPGVKSVEEQIAVKGDVDGKKQF